MVVFSLHFFVLLAMESASKETEALVARRRAVLGGSNLRLFFDPTPLQLVRLVERKEEKKSLPHQASEQRRR